MSRIISLSTLFMLMAAPAMANAPGGGYEGISAMFYGVIGIILAYGAYDIYKTWPLHFSHDTSPVNISIASLSLWLGT